MLISYFVGAMIGGGIAGLSFDVGAAGAGGVVACLFTKLFSAAVFAAVPLLLGVVAKQRLWSSVLGSLAACMIMYTTIPMIAPLNATYLNVILSFAGAAAFAAGFGALSILVLNKTNIA